MTARLLAALLLGLTACPSPAAAPASSAARAVLVVHCPLADALVTIDESLVGEISDLPGGVRLPAGPHRVAVSHDGHHPRYLEVTLAPGETRVVDITLAEVLP